MELELIRRRFAEARVARMATVRPDGRPHLVPVCFALDGETVYSGVDEKPKTTPHLARLRNIRANPSVELLVDHYDEDWDRVWWVRVWGAARVEEAGEPWERGVTLLGEKYPQYEGWSLGAVIVLDIDGWRGWSAR